MTDPTAVEEPLVDPAALSGFPGAPYTDTVVAAASASIRADAGWHIAPQRTETLTLDHHGGVWLVLPTLHLVEVAEVRNADGDVVDGWTASRAGVLHRERGFPAGLGAVDVDLTHGYAACPPELLPVIAERCQTSTVNRSVSQEQSGKEMLTFLPPPGSRRMRRELRHYVIPPRP